jgi:hypothetical protein
VVEWASECDAEKAFCEESTECGRRTCVFYPSPLRRRRIWPNETFQCIGRIRPRTGTCAKNKPMRTYPVGCRSIALAPIRSQGGMRRKWRNSNASLWASGQELQNVRTHHEQLMTDRLNYGRSTVEKADSNAGPKRRMTNPYKALEILTLVKCFVAIQSTKLMLKKFLTNKCLYFL